MKILIFILLLVSLRAHALNTVAEGFKVDDGEAVEIDAHSTCKEVTNNSGFAQFMATKASTEWSSFLAQLPSGISVGNCASSDPCGASPSPGDTCPGGAIYLGELSPGAISGSGTDYYMTTPGGCTDSPTPTCSGADSLIKAWNGQAVIFVDIPALANYTVTIGTGQGANNKDQNYGDDNTAAILAEVSIGPDSAAAYCDNLEYGGYADWYLPNRYELNLFFTNKASIPGLKNGPSDYYWSSTEYSNNFAWAQKFSDGEQYINTYLGKVAFYYVRCVRRY